MFARSVARKIAAPRVQARSINSAAHAVYNTSGKSTSKYIGVVLVACVAGEVVYHGVTDYIWESANKGKLYHQIDWSKFKSEEEDEDE